MELQGTFEGNEAFDMEDMSWGGDGGSSREILRRWGLESQANKKGNVNRSTSADLNISGQPH